MLDLLRSLTSPKVGVRLIVQGSVDMNVVFGLQSMVRATGLLGWIQVIKGSHVLIELEGPKSKLQALIKRLQSMRLTPTPTVIRVEWGPYKGQFQTFRVSI